MSYQIRMRKSGAPLVVQIQDFDGTVSSSNSQKPEQLHPLYTRPENFYQGPDDARIDSNLALFACQNLEVPDQAVKAAMYRIDQRSGVKIVFGSQRFLYQFSKSDPAELECYAESLKAFVALFPQLKNDIEKHAQGMAKALANPKKGGYVEKLLQNFVDKYDNSNAPSSNLFPDSAAGIKEADLKRVINANHKNLLIALAADYFNVTPAEVYLHDDYDNSQPGINYYERATTAFGAHFIPASPHRSYDLQTDLGENLTAKLHQYYAEGLFVELEKDQELPKDIQALLLHHPVMLNALRQETCVDLMKLSETDRAATLANIKQTSPLLADTLKGIMTYDQLLLPENTSAREHGLTQLERDHSLLYQGLTQEAIHNAITASASSAMLYTKAVATLSADEHRSVRILNQVFQFIRKQLLPLWGKLEAPIKPGSQTDDTFVASAEYQTWQKRKAERERISLALDDRTLNLKQDLESIFTEIVESQRLSVQFVEQLYQDICQCREIKNIFLQVPKFKEMLQAAIDAKYKTFQSTESQTITPLVGECHLHYLLELAKTSPDLFMQEKILATLIESLKTSQASTLQTLTARSSQVSLEELMSAKQGALRHLENTSDGQLRLTIKNQIDRYTKCINERHILAILEAQIAQINQQLSVLKNTPEQAREPILSYLYSSINPAESALCVQLIQDKGWPISNYFAQHYSTQTAYLKALLTRFHLLYQEVKSLKTIDAEARQGQESILNLLLQASAADIKDEVLQQYLKEDVKDTEIELFLQLIKIRNLNIKHEAAEKIQTLAEEAKQKGRVFLRQDNENIISLALLRHLWESPETDQYFAAVSTHFRDAIIFFQGDLKGTYIANTSSTTVKLHYNANAAAVLLIELLRTLVKKFPIPPTLCHAFQIIANCFPADSAQKEIPLAVFGNRILGPQFAAIFRTRFFDELPEGTEFFVSSISTLLGFAHQKESTAQVVAATTMQRYREETQAALAQLMQQLTGWQDCQAVVAEKAAPYFSNECYQRVRDHQVNRTGLLVTELLENADTITKLTSRVQELRARLLTIGQTDSNLIEDFDQVKQALRTTQSALEAKLCEPKFKTLTKEAFEAYFKFTLKDLNEKNRTASLLNFAHVMNWNITQVVQAKLTELTAEYAHRADVHFFSGSDETVLPLFYYLARNQDFIEHNYTASAVSAIESIIQKFIPALQATYLSAAVLSAPPETAAAAPTADEDTIIISSPTGFQSTNQASYDPALYARMFLEILQALSQVNMEQNIQTGTHALANALKSAGSELQTQFLPALFLKTLNANLGLALIKLQEKLPEIKNFSATLMALVSFNAHASEPMIAALFRYHADDAKKALVHLLENLSGWGREECEQFIEEKTQVFIPTVQVSSEPKEDRVNLYDASLKRYEEKRAHLQESFNQERKTLQQFIETQLEELHNKKDLPVSPKDARVIVYKADFTLVEGRINQAILEKVTNIIKKLSTEIKEIDQKLIAAAIAGKNITIEAASLKASYARLSARAHIALDQREEVKRSIQVRALIKDTIKRYILAPHEITPETQRALLKLWRACETRPAPTASSAARASCETQPASTTSSSRRAKVTHSDQELIAEALQLGEQFRGFLYVKASPSSEQPLYIGEYLLTLFDKWTLPDSGMFQHITLRFTELSQIPSAATTTQERTNSHTIFFSPKIHKPAQRLTDAEISEEFTKLRKECQPT